MEDKTVYVNTTYKSWSKEDLIERDKLLDKKTSMQFCENCSYIGCKRKNGAFINKKNKYSYFC